MKKVTLPLKEPTPESGGSVAPTPGEASPPIGDFSGTEKPGDEVETLPATPVEVPTPTEEDDSFLSEDLTDVDTSFPLIQEGPCDLEIKKVERKATKDGRGELLIITLALCAERETVKGDVVQKGFPITTRIPITPTAGYTEDMIKRKVALFVQAAGGTRLFPLTQWTGLVLPCRITIRKERTDKTTGEFYEASNDVKFVKQ
jgi:hypothetical protein